MQRFNFPVEDGFRDADRTVRDGLRQTAACEQTTGNKRQRQRVIVAIQKFLLSPSYF
jgi:hypothetical protein